MQGNVVVLVAALVVPQVLSLGGAAGAPRGYSSTGGSRHPQSQARETGLSGMADAIHDHAPNTWARAQGPRGCPGRQATTSARVVAQALIESTLGASVSAPPARLALYPYDAFLNARLRALDPADIGRVLCELDPVARSWAAGREGSGPDQARQAVEHVQRALYQLQGETYAAALVPIGRSATVVDRSQPVPSVRGRGRSLRPMGWLALGGRALAQLMERARRHLVPPALRLGEIEVWLDALHEDLKFGVTTESGRREQGPVVRVGSLRDVPPTARDQPGSYALTPAESATMIKGALRRYDLSAFAVAMLLKKFAPAGTTAETVARAVRLLSDNRSVLREIGGAVERSCHASADHGEGSLSPIIEAQLGRVLHGPDAALKRLFIAPTAPSDGVKKTSPQGAWRELLDHWKGLARIVEVDQDRVAWGQIVAVLRDAEGRGSR